MLAMAELCALIGRPLAAAADQAFTRRFHEKVSLTTRRRLFAITSFTITTAMLLVVAKVRDPLITTCAIAISYLATSLNGGGYRASYLDQTEKYQGILAGV